MSLINQMLRDLEQRRTVEAGPSPLGGLSASGSLAQSVNFSINYTTLAIVVVMVFVAGVVAAYLLGGQQKTIELESSAITMVENSVPVQIKNAVQNNQETFAPPAKIQKAQLVVKPDAPAKTKPLVIEKTPPKAIEKPVIDKPVPVQDAPMIITPIVTDVAHLSDEVSSEDDQGISKTIRPMTAEEQSQQAFQRAIKMLGNGRQQNAQLALEDALSFSPAHIRARETLAAMLLNAGRVSEAAGSLREGLQLMPDATPLAKLYARILVDQGDVSEAVNILERARPAVSADPDYYALLAALYRQEKKHAQAAQTYQQILMQRPGVASWWMGLALSKDAMGEDGKALDAFRRALRAGGLSAEIMQYMQTRIIALTSASTASVSSRSETDEFGE